jgi:hypothetical protein
VGPTGIFWENDTSNSTFMTSAGHPMEGATSVVSVCHAAPSKKGLT